uniref:Uncharacterized protein n=1 Tax=Anopheles coluzzii TaxID=1518534 RepID=A0A8W7PIM2_ANOCL
MQRHARHRALPSVDRCPAPLVRFVHLAAFRGASQIHRTLRDDAVRFRQPDGLDGAQRCGRYLQCVRVRQPDIFARHPHHAPADVARILAGRNHARRPVQGGVVVRGADGFVQRGYDVVVLVALPIVQQVRFLQTLAHILQRDGDERIGERAAVGGGRRRGSTR